MLHPGPLPRLLGRICAASEALLGAIESSDRKALLSAEQIESLNIMLLEVDRASDPIIEPGVARSALMVALLNSINAAFRWPAARTSAGMQAEKAAAALCETALAFARDLFEFDINGKFLRNTELRDDAVAFARALLESHVLQSCAQRFAEASAAAMDELRHQQQQQQPGDQRPMGLEGLAAVGSSGRGASSSANTGTASSKQQHQWKPQLGQRRQRQPGSKQRRACQR